MTRSYYVTYALSGYEQTRIPIELEAEEADRIYELGRNGGTFSVESGAMYPLRDMLRHYAGLFAQEPQFDILDSRFSAAFRVTTNQFNGERMWTVRLWPGNSESDVSFLQTMRNSVYESWIAALFVGPYLDPRVYDDDDEEDEDSNSEDEIQLHMQRQASAMRHVPDAA